MNMSRDYMLESIPPKRHTILKSAEGNHD